MNKFPDDHTPNDVPQDCDSCDAVNLEMDGPEDNTTRPCRPERRAFLEAERDKLIRWGTLPLPQENGDAQ
jgi:hypothetical protein